jgi:hypothetical protein
VAPVRRDGDVPEEAHAGLMTETADGGFLGASIGDAGLLLSSADHLFSRR